MYEKKTGWQYKIIVAIFRVISSITNTIDNFCYDLEMKAYKRWGGYKVTNYPSGTDEPWCKMITASNVPREDVDIIRFEANDLTKEVQPGDIVYFNWDDNER